MAATGGGPGAPAPGSAEAADGLLQPAGAALLRRARAALEPPGGGAPDPAELAGPVREFLAARPAPGALPEAERAAWWGLAHELFNRGLDLPDAEDGPGGDGRARVQQLACDVVVHLRDHHRPRAAGPLETHALVLSFLQRTGEAWLRGQRYAEADACFQRAEAHVQPLEADLQKGLRPGAWALEVLETLLAFFLSRARAAVATQEVVLLSDLVGRAKKAAALLSGVAALDGLPADVLRATLRAATRLYGTGYDILQEHPEESIECLEACLQVLRTGSPDAAPEPDRAAVARLEAERATLRNLCMKSLAAAHLDRKKYTACLNFCENLEAALGGRAEVARDAGHASLHYLMVEALLGLRRFDEAAALCEESLVPSAVPATDQLYDLVGESLAELHKAGQAGPAVRLMGRLAELGKLTGARAYKFVACALEPHLLAAEPAGPAGGAPPGGAPPAAFDRALLGFLAEPAVHGLLMNPDADAHRTKLVEALHGVAVRQFQAISAAAAEPAQAAHELWAADLAHLREGERDLRARCARCAAMALLALRRYDAAGDYLCVAEENAPRLINNSFLRFKLHLLKDEGPQAVAEVDAMTRCDGFSNDFFVCAIQEAFGSHHFDVMRGCLGRMLDAELMVRPGAGGTGGGGGASTSLLTILRIMLYVEGKEPEPNWPAVLKTLATVLEVLSAPERAPADRDAKALEWLWGTAHNFAKRARDEGDHATFARLMHAAVRLRQHCAPAGPADDARELAGQLDAVLAAGMVAVEEGPGVLAAGEVKALADLGQAAAERLRAAGGADAAEQYGPYLALLRTHLACKTADAAAQLRCVAALEAQALEPRALVCLARIAEGNLGDPAAQDPAAEVLNAALRLALKKAIKLPEYRLACYFLRRLYHLVDTEERLSLLQQAAKVLRTAEDVRSDDLRWLAATAWNYGQQLHTFVEDFAKARPWLEVGLQFLEQCPAMEAECAARRRAFAQLAGGPGADGADAAPGKAAAPVAMAGE